MSRVGWIGFAIVAFMVIVATCAPIIAPYDPYDASVAKLEEGREPPSKLHWFGTDTFGRDLLSSIIYGARISLSIGIITTFISALLGLVLGSIAGYFGKRIDELIMRITDITFAFPGLLLAIALSAVLGPALRNVVIALSITGWAGYTRLIRGQILSLKELEYIQASKSMGAKNLRIITRHIWPNIANPLIVQMTFGVAGVIIGESSLSFLGLGAPLGTPSWGGMLNEGRRALLTSPYLSIFPGIAIMLTIIGFNFLGDSLRDMLDPQSHPLRRVTLQ